MNGIRLRTKGKRGQAIFIPIVAYKETSKSSLSPFSLPYCSAGTEQINEVVKGRKQYTMEGALIGQSVPFFSFSDRVIDALKRLH